MAHMTTRRDFWSFTAGFLSIFNLEIAAHDSTPIEDPNVFAYQTDFSTPVGSEWSSDSISVTPKGERDFLGEFTANTRVSLHISDLPRHDSVTVAFDLFLLQSRERGDLPPKRGPNLFEFTAGQSERQLRYTFLNESDDYNTGQSFPEPFSHESPPRFRARTVALETDSLGYSSDSVYRLTITFDQSATELTLQFEGIGIADESWGLDNVSVTASETRAMAEGSAILVGEALEPLEPAMTPYSLAPDVSHSSEASSGPEIAQSEGGSVTSFPSLGEITLNQTLSLQAVPNKGFAFEGWQGDISSTDNPLTLTYTDNIRVFAAFKPLWPLIIEQVEGGRILTNPVQSEFIEGSIVSVLGIPDEGYRFDRWLGSLSGNQSAGTLNTKNAGALIINEAKSVSAVFVAHQAPEIASDMTTSRIKVGDKFAIEAIVTGTASLGFQWLKDEIALPGATSATLTLSAAQPADSGIYSLVATNDAGEVQKDLLDLGVQKPLALISQPSEVVETAHSLVLTPSVKALPITSDPINIGQSSRLEIKTSEGQLRIEIIGESDGEVWDIERTTDLLDWAPVEKVVLEMEDGFASAILNLPELDGQVAFFRARKGSLQNN